MLQGDMRTSDRGQVSCENKLSWVAGRKMCLTDGLHDVGALLEDPLLDMVVELVESRLSLSVSGSYSTWSRTRSRRQSKR
eukprot:6005630-Prymnesium_polylepis.1